MPEVITDWSDHEGRDYIDFLKGIKQEMYGYIKCLEDDYSQLREIYVDEHQEKQSAVMFHKAVISLKTRLITTSQWTLMPYLVTCRKNRSCS